MDHALSIGALARRSGTTPPTIRYYEEIGLVRRAARRDGGHRTYGDADLKRLTFIRRCRELGFPIDQVRSLVDLLENGDRSCLDARDLARRNLEDVQTKLSELLGVSTSRVSDYLTGRCEPTLKVAREISRKLNIDADIVLGV